MEYQTSLKKDGQRRKLSFVLFLAVFTLLTAILLFLFLIPSKSAAASKQKSYERRIVSVKVEKNDSLWKIANRYYCPEKENIREMVKEIKEINHLDDDTIYPDTYLVVQYFVKAD